MKALKPDDVAQQPAKANSAYPAGNSTPPARLDLTDPAYVERCNAMWKVKPSSVVVIEYSGDGDPFFGGSADDRALGADGKILVAGSRVAVASFATIEDAHRAALAIPNRRAGSILGAAPSWNH